MKKRIFSAVLVLVMLITWLPTFTLPAKAENATEHVFDCTADVTAGNDKDPITEGTIFGGYFKVIGTVTQRYKAEKGVYAVEIAKALTGALQFTTAGVADVTLVAASTGGSNESAVGLQDIATEEIIFSTVVSGTGETTLTIEDLPAGTYRIVSPVDAERNRGFRLIRATVSEEAAKPVQTTYVLDSSLDFPIFSGTKEAGEEEVINDYFTVIYRANSKVEAKEKTFDDNYTATQRLSLNGTTNLETMVGSIKFTTSDVATVKLWWIAGGDGRNMAIYDADKNLVVETDKTTSEKDALYITTFDLEQAGTYYLANPNGNNYIFKIEVTEGAADPSARKDWTEVAAPVIVSAADNGEGKINVTVDAIVGKDGGDMLTVTMYDSNGNVVDTDNSLDEKITQHILEFSPADSGNYTFKATLLRTDAAPKETAVTEPVTFKLPLTNPIIVSTTSKGGGTVEVVWAGVKEATAYEIYAEGTLLGTTEGNVFLAEGLTVGQKYAFTIVAVRGEDRTASTPVSAKVTQEAQQTWGFTYYGPSTNAAGNGYVGSVNEDGYVTVYSEGGKGKIQPKSLDGLAFYYTAVPANLNFTLRAKVTVDSWELSNGQEGFGLMVADRLGTSGDSNGIWNNTYMALATKIEYKYEGDENSLHIYDTSYDGGTKITMKMGLGALSKTGITLENLPLFEAGDTTAINSNLVSLTVPLEWAAAEWGREAGTYNVIGNYTQAPGGDIELEMMTEFILEIQKNNTGYFITYYDAEGNILSRQKYYDTEALSQLDSEFVYAGFFASRNARATFSDVVFTTIDPKDDAPAEEKPVTKIQPSITFATDTVCNSLNYQMMIDANVSGTAKVTVAGSTVLDNVQITANQRAYLDIPLAAYGKNRVQVIFTPDPDQDLGLDTVLSSTKDVTETLEIVANKGNYHQKVIYVSPTGLSTGNGTREYPYDICTAVDNVVAGQTIVLMEGTYKMESSLRIKRGIDGTADAPINMIADPEAKTRPVIDFQGLYSGITHGGDYWYFYGFDVTRSLDGQKGFQVSGSNNILDQINTYYNGNTGIQICRYNSKDLLPDWPANNLILNCTSYCNYDKGFEDADGFAAKLTIGEGNVFDGCIAYNNADDGWDLYAKIETGPIGAVTIRNCVAYSNGWVPGVEGEGNGNGFKMGGDSLSGYHVLENSYAFWNLAKGIDSNSCPDIIVINSVSYNNGSYNVAFYTNTAANTDFSATGIVSFKDSTSLHADGVAIGEQLKPKGTQDTSKYANATNYYWDGAVSTNTAGVQITADMFVSLQFNGIERNEDGSINMQGFLQMNETAPAGVGVPADAGSASQNPSTLPENPAHDLPDVWSYLDRLSGHWRECDCGFKGDLADHTFQWVIDSEPTPTTNGKKHEECTVCGYKAPAVTTYYEGPATTQPSDPGTTGEPGSTNTALIIAIVAVLAVAIGAFLVFKFVMKKKEN